MCLGRARGSPEPHPLREFHRIKGWFTFPVGGWGRSLPGHKSIMSHEALKTNGLHEFRLHAVAVDAERQCLASHGYATTAGGCRGTLWGFATLRMPVPFLHKAKWGLRVVSDVAGWLVGLVCSLVCLLVDWFVRLVDCS